MSEQLVRTKVRKQPKRSTQAATCPTLSSVAVSANPGINTLPAFQNLQVA